MRRVTLDTGMENRRVAWLRTPTGADELAAEGGALLLLDRCLVGRDAASVEPGTARSLPVSDRDRLLAALYRMLFGDHIEADTACTRCGEAFSLRFTLTSLVDAQRARHPDGVSGPDAAGCFHLDGVVFRLPSTADLDTVLTTAPGERSGALLRAVVVAGAATGREEAIEAAMEALGPTLDVELDSVCPHCASHQRPRFAIAAFLERRLTGERRFLVREMHRIARAYGWSYETILGIPRNDRQAFVRLIEGEESAPLQPLALQDGAA